MGLSSAVADSPTHADDPRSSAVCATACSIKYTHLEQRFGETVISMVWQILTSAIETMQSSCYLRQALAVWVASTRRQTVFNTSCMVEQKSNNSRTP